MADFYAKVKTITPTVSILPWETGPAHPTTQIEMISGTRLTVPTFQKPMKNPYRNSNLWRYPFSGQYQNALTTGGQFQCPIIRGSGSGHCEDVWLRINATNNTGQTIDMIPAPLWPNYHMWQTPAGATIQTQQGTSLWLNLASTVPLEQWYEVSKAVNSSLDFESGDAIPAGATVTYYIPLVGSFLSAGKFFLPATSGDIQYYVTFWPAASIQTLGSNGALTINAMSIDVKMEQMAPPLLQKTIELFGQQRFDYIIPYYKNQPFQMQITAGQTLLPNLSNISGDVIVADFVGRNSYVGADLCNFIPFGSYQYQNQEGIGISSQQYIDDVFARKINYPRQNKGTLTRNRRVYRHIFANSDDAVEAILKYGCKLGAYPFDNHNNLSLIAAAAGSNEIWTLTSTTAVPTSGSGTFLWITPDDGVGVSLPIPFGSFVTPFTNLQNAIQAIPNFDGSISVAGTWAGGLTFTFSGSYANRPLQALGYALILQPGTLAISGAPSLAYMNVSSVGIDGITTGNTFLVDVYATTTGVVSILPDGSMKAYNS
jgi:hypothetical protein